MLRLSLDCARIAVHGEDYAPILAAGVHKILKTDAGTGLVFLTLGPGGPVTAEIVMAGVPPLPSERNREALRRVDRHPMLSRPNWVGEGTYRLSDHVLLPSFWETDVWFYFHGHSNGRYGAAAPLISVSNRSVFIAVQRTHHDFDSADMDVLDAVRGPLAAALAFRHAWDDATNRLHRSQSASAQDNRLTRREAQVLALVARGWTNHRVGHVLGITERTVRKHLENVNGKLGVQNRAAAAARWENSLALSTSSADVGKTHRSITNLMPVPETNGPDGKPDAPGTTNRPPPHR